MTYDSPFAFLYFCIFVFLCGTNCFICHRYIEVLSFLLDREGQTQVEVHAGQTRSRLHTSAMTISSTFAPHRHLHVDFIVIAHKYSQLVLLRYNSRCITCFLMFYVFIRLHRCFFRSREKCKLHYNSIEFDATQMHCYVIKYSSSKLTDYTVVIV